ncbi:uncharacterized protein LOC123013094 [Tribolium madens]|uniref:uncharacterized protein LOC123013094 n=1 Tax=Tribolium madens TaxID=41895 RepID=UPI001CF73368|nr:uncharacterized protein LOC123013094 [Tribolium madens]XP_044267365.1 uncharacterized protein LOC123013094 [Tribolium madens]XP_044267366.1 uncharacterized protein LOC123013094 [Tribolium madens]
MNPDEYDFRRNIPNKEPSSEALHFIRGLEDRSLNHLKKNIKAKVSREVFAEDELVRKKCYDEMRCEMPGQPRSTFLMVFSPDGTKVASTHGNHNIYVTDIKSGKNIKTLTGHPRTPWCIAFHPTSNQIVASGCLGGEVRIWDLSGGSEVWTAGNQSVIASIAFHPNDRILVIATYNELYFWDWSMPEPFVQVATANPKEKIRYVAFDKLGHKLITGIANSPQTRWERVRAPVPVPRQAERSASPYRLRITPRLVNTPSPPERTYFNVGLRPEQPSVVETTREALSSVPERERRITASYRNLLREYEQLVQRYLKVYKPPTMIDRGTDPMEPNATSATSSTQAPESEPSTSGTNNPSNLTESQPSTSQNYSSSLVMPSRILAMKKQPTEAHSTQTSDSRKHKSSENTQESTQEKRSKSNDSGPSSHTETATQTQSPRRLLVINERPQPEPSTSGLQDKPVRNSGVRILCPKKRKLLNVNESEAGCSNSEPQPSTSQGSTSGDILQNIRPITEEVRNRFLPIIKSLPACDRPKLIRRFENSRAHERMKFRQMCPTFIKKPNRRPVLDTSSDSSSSDDEHGGTLRSRMPIDLTTNTTNQNRNTCTTNQNDREPECVHTASSSNPPSNPSTSSSNTSNISGVRSFIMELEQLLMTILLTEIESNESQNSASVSNNNNSPINLSNTPPATSNQDEQVDNSNVRSSPVSMSATRDQDLIRPNAVPLGFGTFRRLIQRHENQDQSESRTPTSNSDEPSRSSPGSSNGIYSRTSSPIYNRTYPRRRLPAHRISAFMPTRVNYNRIPMRYRRGSSFRLGSRLSVNSTFPIDELINYSERPNAEDNVPQDNIPESSPLVPPSEPSPFVNLGNMYSNIVQDLESSLNDVRNIRSSTRPSETSDMLSSFSESLENIMNQSDTILRNLGGSMSMLPNYSEQNESRRRETSEPRVSFNDQNFYIRSNSPQEASTSGGERNLSDVLAGGRSVVESDHNYPRNPGNNQIPNSGENMSPLMTSLHLTISYIQRQARLLRHQVESIERIDRTMFEVEQLQLIRQLITEFLRYVRSLAGESRSTGMSSVRQMMAGTRISDSSPYDSQSEEQPQQPPQPVPSSSTSNDQSQPRPRTSGRKTYPPSRLFRLQRHNRRSLFVNFFPRRYTGRPERGVKHTGPCRNAPSRTPAETTNPLRHLSSHLLINSSSLNLMARRLEHFLTEQTRLITRPQESNTGSIRSTAATELGERILSIRLYDCVMRMNRIMGNGFDSSRFRNTRSDLVVVTQDGASRFPARHFLSLIVDGMSKHLEELAGSNISQSLRGQIHSVLAMALLLSDLLLLQLVDSIPPPAGMNLDVERESLTSRIDQMCGQMLQNRFSGHSHQLTRSLQHMRLNMRRAYRALGQTYNARRNAMLPNRPDTNRRQLLNRYLRNINLRRQQNPGTDPTTSSSDTGARENSNVAPVAPAENTGNENVTRGWSSLRDLIMRYSDNTGEDEDVTSSNSNQDSQERTQRFETVSSNNSDDNDDESEWYVNNSNRSTNLYRTNNVNLVHNNPEESSSNPSRPWNVPSVQVNDVPVPIAEQPSLFQQRIMTHRQRLAERVSELRTFPQMGGLRPRFLHPLYASVNPFDADLDDPQRETNNYDCDMITTVTPNHRIQMWDISSGNIPVINNPLKNLIVSECKIHNDASVDIAKDGTILVTLLPSGGYLNVTNKLGVYSLRWDTLGQCLYTTSFEQNAVSVALSPLSRHLVVGLASRRVSIVPSDRWTMARIFIIEQKNAPGDRLPVLRELGQNRDSRANYKSVNCIRWLPTSGQGLIYATNTGQLVILT